MTHESIKDFMKGSRNNTQVEINNYTIGDYATLKRDFAGTDFFTRCDCIESWDACDYVTESGDELTLVSIATIDDRIDIRNTKADRINALVDELNGMDFDDEIECAAIVNKINKLLPSRVWLCFKFDYFELCYQAHGNRYFIPVELY